MLHHELIKTAKRFPNKVAIIDTAMGTQYTYERLLIAVLIVSSKLSKMRSTHIGIMLPNSAGCLISLIGSLCAGKVPLMINYSTGARENCLYAQNKCSFKTIITSRKLVDRLNIEAVPGTIFIEDILSTVTLADKLRGAFLARLPWSVLSMFVYGGELDDTATILFTSGSELDPKAVQLTHRNFMHQMKNIPLTIDVSDKDIIASNLPLFHVFGLTICGWLPLYLGATAVTVANPLEYRFVCECIRKYRISVMVATPSFFHGYLRKAVPGDFASMRWAVAGADKLPRQIREGFQQSHNLEILEGYGTTETSPVVSLNVGDANKLGSIGRPMKGVSVKIVDRETGEDLPPNAEGKILVKGELVMKGYYNDYEQTSLRIRNGWYDTGDMGIIDEDGFIWHRGRLKRFVKIGGEMVSLVKVESVLEELLPEGTICCVVDVPNPTKGADIVAAVTTREIDFKNIKKILARELPTIAIPREFYVMPELPMASSGKVNFREVEKICRDIRENQER
jgi:acyl-[acyl-carrier-protein]-phospholipid O-acyltransferase / long-chain-fatty-acid--[acyl-carrier-protein] ligase